MDCRGAFLKTHLWRELVAPDMEIDALCCHIAVNLTRQKDLNKTMLYETGVVEKTERLSWRKRITLFYW